MLASSNLETNSERIVIVTGASEGIGKAISLTLLDQGFKVVLVSRSIDKLHNAVSQHNQYSSSFHLYPADMTDSMQVDGLVKNVGSIFGKVSILVNNLGKGLRRSLINTTDDEWNMLMNINLSSAFFLCRSVLPEMRANMAGHIINISSRAGRRGEGDFAAYCTFKHGLVGLTRALADSEADFGIKVNAICPGPVATDRMLKSYPDTPHPDWVTPQEIAQTVLFLISEAGSRMNGMCLDLFSN